MRVVVVVIVVVVVVAVIVVVRIAFFFLNISPKIERVFSRGTQEQMGLYPLGDSPLHGTQTTNRKPNEKPSYLS